MKIKEKVLKEYHKRNGEVTSKELIDLTLAEVVKVIDEVKEEFGEWDGYHWLKLRLTGDSRK